jgi:hypothetical protein
MYLVSALKGAKQVGLKPGPDTTSGPAARAGRASAASAAAAVKAVVSFMEVSLVPRVHLFLLGRAGDARWQDEAPMNQHTALVEQSGYGQS